MVQMLYLTSKDVHGLATPEEYVNSIADGYFERGNGAPATPPKKLVSGDNDEISHVNYKAILPDMGVMGGYDYAALSDAWFVTPIFSTETGEPLAIIDGTSMNPLKTGGVGAVAVDHLAREDSSILGIIGSGTQARGQLRAIATVRDLEEVRIYSRTKDNRERMATHFNQKMDSDVYAVNSSREAIDNADIVVTATTASSPVFEGRLLEDGAHVNEVGSNEATKREVDSNVIKRSKYILDHRDRLLENAGSFIHAFETGAITRDHLYGELGDIVSGNLPGRESRDEITVFDSRGTAIETISVAYMLYQKGIEKGLGTKLEIASMNGYFDESS